MLESILEDEELAHKEPVESLKLQSLPKLSLTPSPRHSVRHRTDSASTTAEITNILNALSGEDSESTAAMDSDSDIATEPGTGYSSLDRWSRTVDSSLFTAESKDSPLLSATDREGDEAERKLFLDRNWKRIEKTRNTLQGEIIKAEVLWTAKLQKTASGLDAERETKYVAIKKTSKELYSKKIGALWAEDTMFCIEEDAVNEAEVLRRLTVDHSHRIDDDKCHVVRYRDAFESDTHFYLATEYIADQYTLCEFVADGLDHVDCGRLGREEYLKVIRYLFWQILVTIHWMHSGVKCCHLKLTMKSVLIQNGSFLPTSDGQRVSVDQRVGVKLTEFGMARFFERTGRGPPDFTYFKSLCLVDEVQYDVTLVHDSGGRDVDGRKADMWSLGMMLFHCAVGRPLFSKMCSPSEHPEEYKGSGFWAASTGNVMQFVLSNNLQRFVDGKLLSLIHCLLTPDEGKRFGALRALQHEWFRKYYERYEQKMARYRERYDRKKRLIQKEAENKQKQQRRRSVATSMAYR